jgi:putative DNA primase/helicase
VAQQIAQPGHYRASVCRRSGESEIGVFASQFAPGPCRNRRIRTPRGGRPESLVTLKVPSYSEDAIALAFIEEHGADWLFTPAPSRWHRWSDDGWKRDDKREIFSVTRAICRKFAAAAAGNGGKQGDVTLARGLASARMRAAIVNLASDDQRIVRTLDQFDMEPYLLGTPGGHAVDLRSGDLLPPDRTRLITMRTAVMPAPKGTERPLWTKFLDTTFPLEPGNPHSPPNQELIDYLRRWFGYSLTGDTSEERFAFLLGQGRNGKNTLIDTLSGIMGDYAAVLPAEALMERSHEQHRAELADLCGKRLVISSEIPKGKRWNQSRLMSLSAGDMQTANFMRENPFTFKFTGKLWIAGNHAPAFPSSNTAAKERLALIKFRMKFYHLAEHPELKDNPDPMVAERTDDLKVLMREEWPAILRWGIDGASIWQREGLNPPGQVLADSNDYSQDHDECAEWMAFCCIPSEGSPLAELFASWNLWRIDRAQRPTSSPEFRDMLKDKDLQIERKNYGMKVIGFALNDVARAKVIRAKQERENHRCNGAEADEGAF